MAYSYNAGGGAITIERTAVGRYDVDVETPGVPLGNVQVTAYDSSAHCMVKQFGATKASVGCYDKDAALVDAKFSLAAFGPAASDANVTAYAFADKESVAQYGPNANYSFNSAGGSMTAYRSQPGTYRLRFGDLSLSQGNVQVSALGSQHHCSVVSWFGDEINVNCYNENGFRADTKYVAMVIQESTSTTSVLGYARTTSSSDATTDLTGNGTAFNATGGTITANRTALGVYQVVFAGLDLNVAHAQVTSMFYDDVCSITQVASDWVKVGCFDSTGAATDTLFNVLVVD